MAMKRKGVLGISIAGAVVAIVVIIILITAVSSGPTPAGDGKDETPLPEPVAVQFGEPYAFNKQGYEPGIASDSTGALFYTAHKNLDDKSSWDYPASWFFVSTDGGATWDSPSQPRLRGDLWKTYLGDEGDIAIDGRDYVYFVDTYLLDNHIHVWADQGNYQYSVRVQKTTGLDDRPWISAQASGVLHYLGNNAVEVNGGRYWYYRSGNGGRTWTAGEPVPGNGWAHIDADRNGDHVYIVSESEVGAAADILMYVSDDGGRSWNWDDPVLIGHRDGPGREYPVVSTYGDGIVWVLWNDATNGVENGTSLFIGRSLDAGRTWETWNMTPFQAFFDYPTINAGPDGSVAVAFYASDGLPISPESEWYVYGGMDPFGASQTPSINFTKADPTPTYVGEDLHALHDFFEIVITPDLALNIAYQYYIGPENGHSLMYFVKGNYPTMVL
ncbi:MAG: glycoside hydrolase [Candidatus Thermoplasmatota archaeon]|jgi:hypothetical protein|nr:glycoside hydrolase [Candidatus Thermoplasmatota archaeon]